ncbi:MAG: hypothetical protein IJL74_03700 [Bacilli bacterium]|nr:hypothetical protein [Bacilli bacterium]
MGLFKKELYLLDAFEKVPINFEKEKSNPESKITKLCENEEYVFYGYYPQQTLHYTYIVGQLKSKPKKAIYFAKSYDFVEVYHDHLFLCNKGGETNTDGANIKVIDLKNNSIDSLRFRGKYNKMVFVGGYGRSRVLDEYKNMKVINDELIISAHRAIDENEDKSDDPDNKDMDYKIVFKYDNNKFTYHFEIEKVNKVREVKIKKEELASYAGLSKKLNFYRDETNHIKPNYYKALGSNFDINNKKQVKEFIEYILFNEKIRKKYGMFTIYDYSIFDFYDLNTVGTLNGDFPGYYLMSSLKSNTKSIINSDWRTVDYGYICVDTPSNHVFEAQLLFSHNWRDMNINDTKIECYISALAYEMNVIDGVEKTYIRSRDDELVYEDYSLGQIRQSLPISGYYNARVVSYLTGRIKNVEEISFKLYFDKRSIKLYKLLLETEIGDIELYVHKKRVFNNKVNPNEIKTGNIIEATVCIMLKPVLDRNK